MVDDACLHNLNEAKERRGFMVFTVLINVKGDSSSENVQAFSDEVITVSSLAQLDNDGTALNLFSKVKAR